MILRPSTLPGRTQLILDFMDGIHNRGEQEQPFKMPMDRTKPYGNQKQAVVMNYLVEHIDG